MSPVDLVTAWYATRDRSLTAEDAELVVRDTFPFGGIYRGHAEIYEGFFSSLYEHFTEFGLTRERIVADGDTVIVLGHYRGRLRDGDPEFKVPFTHVWTVSEGKLVRIVQHAETGVIDRAIAASDARADT